MAAAKPKPSDCIVAKKYPQFQYLTHQTSVSNLSNIYKQGYLLPPRYYQSDEQLQARIDSVDPRDGQIEGIYMSLVFDHDAAANKRIHWFESKGKKQCILVFSVALLDRNDYYFSLRDQFGTMTTHSYTKQYLDKVPKIRFNPELETSLGIVGENETLVLHAGLNEIMFFEKVSLAFLEEIWLSPSNTDTIAPPPSILGSFSVPIRKSVTYFPFIKSVKGCDNPALLEEQQKYQGLFCRNERIFGIGNFALPFADPSNFGFSRYSSLSTLKKIASNCFGISKSEIDAATNRDHIYILIRKSEERLLKQWLEDRKKGIKFAEERLREALSRRKKVYLPPFLEQYSSEPDKEIDTRDFFYEIINNILELSQDELKYAIENDLPSVNNVIKLLQKREEKAKKLLSDHRTKIYLWYLIYYGVEDYIMNSVKSKEKGNFYKVLECIVSKTETILKGAAETRLVKEIDPMVKEIVKLVSLDTPDTYEREVILSQKIGAIVEKVLGIEKDCWKSSQSLS